MKKKNPNNFSLSVLLTSVLGCTVLAFLLYLLITGIKGTDSRLNLASENISYLAQVSHMDSITDEEVNTIKSDVQEAINEKMNSLKLEPDIDYTVNDLNDIATGTRLDAINVTVAAIKNSTKAKGTLVVELNGQEDISDRSVSTINIPTSQENSLSALRAANIKSEISFNVNEILTKGQITEEGIDYQIVGLDLIVYGAKFTDYNSKVSVASISSSIKLKGSFVINFQLTNS